MLRGPAAWQIGRLWDPATGTTAGLRDGQLLDRFLERRDPAAFEALVGRHGPMVMAVCRGVLRDPHAAEDAFQATFLVLIQEARSVRGPDALGGWLHRVARRTAIRAGRKAARRRDVEAAAGRAGASRRAESDEWDELRPILHDEIARLPEKLRAPIVLCDLEGVPQPQAAAHLNWSERTLQRRLASARARLGSRLAGGGSGPAVVPLAALLAREARGSASKRSLDAAVRAATVLVARGSAAGPAGILAREVIRMLWWTRMKITCLALLGVGVATWAGAALVAQGPPGEVPAPRSAGADGPSARPEPPRGDPPGFVAIEGRVLDPGGEPSAGAGVYVRHNRWDEAGSTTPTVERVAEAGRDGRFRFMLDRSRSDNPAGDGPAWRGALIAAVAPGSGATWTSVSAVDPRATDLRLVEEGPPIRGRITDGQGRGVAAAGIALRWLANVRGDVDRAALVASGRLDFDGMLVPTLRAPNWAAPTWIGRAGTLRTDAAGYFELKGIGRDQVAVLAIEHPGLERATIAVMAHPPRDPATPRPKTSPTFDPLNGEMGLMLYGAAFEHGVGPSKPIAGVVRLGRTGQPLAGATVAAQVRGMPWSTAMTTTDAQGRYRLEGIPKAELYGVDVRPAPGAAYHPDRKSVGDTAGLQPIEVDFDLARAVGVTGRLLDRATGKPVAGSSVTYLALPGNRLQVQNEGIFAAADSTYRVTAATGPGIIAAKVLGEGNPYPGARLRPEDKGKLEVRGENGAQYGFLLSSYVAYRVVDLPEDAGAAVVDLEVEPGPSRLVEVVGPDGRPVRGASVRGMTNDPWASGVVAGATFEVRGLGPDEARVVEVVLADQDLAGSITVAGGPPAGGPLVVKLAPCGVIVGRLVDPDDQPLGGAKVVAVAEHSRGFVATDPAFRHREAVTDRDGRFRIARINPASRATLAIQDPRHPAPRFATEWVHDPGVLAVGPGAVLDLGDARVRTVPGN